MKPQSSNARVSEKILNHSSFERSKEVSASLSDVMKTIITIAKVTIRVNSLHRVTKNYEKEKVKTWSGR
ncbi:hypothetical protein [Pseudothermotoga sp.]